MLALTSSKSSALLPLSQARVPVVIRVGELRDVPFMDGLQRMHTKMVGFFPTAQFEGNIKQGRVLIAEEMIEDGGSKIEDGAEGSLRSSIVNPLPSIRTPIGYCIAADRYFKHDDVGIIYQMNVKPGRQRSLVGAMLLKAQFERSAYGCKLYCCWCAQDIAANKFWEAMGFVALAFRTGGTASGKKPARMHIFWQKRIRAGDETTPWWFPGETTGGAIKENRIVLPIPPGTHWSDAKPLVLPGLEFGESAVKALPAKRTRKPRKELVVIKPSAIVAGGLRFGALVPEVIEEKVQVTEKRVRQKNDPRLVAAARELKDRWLEEVNGGLYPPEARGKYDVTRAIEGPGATQQIGTIPGAKELPLSIAA
jgi:hypothetical protein